MVHFDSESWIRSHPVRLRALLESAPKPLSKDVDRDRSTEHKLRRAKSCPNPTVQGSSTLKPAAPTTRPGVGYSTKLGCELSLSCFKVSFQLDPDEDAENNGLNHRDDASEDTDCLLGSANCLLLSSRLSRIISA